MLSRRLRLRAERLAELTGAELTGADLARVAGAAPPTWYECPTVPVAPCLSREGDCEPLIDWETSFCETER